MKNVLAFFICYVCVGVEGVTAQTNAENDAAKLYQTHTFELGPAVSYIRYKERGLKIDGPVYGFVASYAYHYDLMVKGEFNFNYGKVNYSASTMTGRASGDNTLNEMWEVRGLGGYDFPLLTSSILTPYIGIGLRYINNDVLPTPQEREFYYLYSPIGIGVMAGLGHGWSNGGMGEYDLFWRGDQNSHPIDRIPSLKGDVRSHQKDGYGVRGSLTLEKKYAKIIVGGGPFLRYWSVDKLSPRFVPYNVLWQEPASDSLEAGMMLSVKF